MTDLSTFIPGRLARNAILAFLYFAAGWIGLLLDRVGPSSILYWPAAGLAIAALVRFGTDTWPGLFVGALAVGLVSRLNLGVAILTAAGNTLAPFTAVAVLGHFSFDRLLRRRRDVALFATTIPIAMWISAVIGIAALAWGGMPVKNTVGSMLDWWLGDTLGTLTLAPLLLTVDGRVRQVIRGRGVELGSLILLTTAGSAIVWASDGSFPAYFSLVTLAWAAARFDAPIPPLVVTIIATLAAVGTAWGAGPYSGFTPDARTGPLVSFLATVAMLNLLIGALIAERTQADLSRQRSEEQLADAVVEVRSANALLAGIHDVQTSFIAEADPAGAFGRILPVMLDLTASEYGFIAEVIRDDEGKAFLSTHAITNISWDEATRERYARSTASGMVFTNLDTLFGSVVKTSKTVIANDPAGDPRRGGLPPGYPPLSSFLGIPLMRGTELVGMIGLANRPGGYDQSVIDQAQPLTSTCASLIAAIRTERSREAAAEALVNNEHRMRAIVDSASDAIITADHAHRIVVFNRAAERMFGVSAAEAIGHPVDRFVAPSHRGDEDNAPIRFDRPETGRHGFGAIHGLRGDGEEFPVEASISHIGAVDRGLYTIILRDVSERIEAEETRHRLERQLRESQKLEAIGTLAGGIAHDFNNILGAIMGNAEVAAGDLSAEHPAREAFEQINVASRRARDLVRQILAFTRRQESARRPVRIQRVVEEVLGLVRASLPASVEIRARLPEGGSVLADPSEIHQVVMNLCTNAAQAMPNGGLLELTLDRVHLDQSAPQVHTDLGPGGYLRLTVRDSGLGMTPSVIDRIFEPFFTTKPPGKGTGLGLAVVHGIVKSHRGAVTVASQPGVGSTFRLYLPLAAAGEAGEADGDAMPRGDGERILLIDDEPSLISVGKTLLGRLGYKVTGFTNPAAAWEAFKASPDDFDLVITDLTMPELSGLALAKMITGLRPDLPVLVATGYGGVLSPADAADARILDVIEKPTPIEVMASTVRQALDSTRVRPRV